MEQNKIKLEIATPERLVLSETVDEVVLPGTVGSFGVLAGHAPLLSTLDIGELSYRIAGGERHMAISGGYVEVLRQGVQVLAETCEPADEIDVERAKQARERAEKRLADEADGTDTERAMASLRRAVGRIETYERGAG